MAAPITVHAQNVEAGLIYEAQGYSDGSRGHVYDGSVPIEQGSLRFVDIGIVARDQDALLGVTREGKAYKYDMLLSRPKWEPVCTSMAFKAAGDTISTSTITNIPYLINTNGEVVVVGDATNCGVLSMLDVNGQTLHFKDVYATNSTLGGADGIFGVSDDGKVYRYVTDENDTSKHMWKQTLTSVSQPIKNIVAIQSAIAGEYNVLGIGEDGLQYPSKIQPTDSDTGQAIDIAQSRFPHSFLGIGHSSTPQGAVLNKKGTMYQWYEVNNSQAGWHVYDPGFTVKKTVLGRPSSYNGTTLYMLTGGPQDTTPPVINGATDKTITAGDSFDPLSGVTATDDTDGDLTSKIQVSGKVDNQTVGQYTLTYTVSDSAGNQATATRTITVAQGGTTIACAPQTGDPAASVWQVATVAAGIVSFALAGYLLILRRKARMPL